MTKPQRTFLLPLKGLALSLCFVSCVSAPVTPSFQSASEKGPDFPTLTTPEYHTGDADVPEKEGGEELLTRHVGEPEEKISFIWPVKDGRISGEFEAKRKRHLHLGIDIAAPRGSSIFAAHDGRVLYAGRAFKGYGKLVIVESQDGRWATFYSHCQKFFVKRGQTVKQGKVIAAVGKTGRATGYHVHFEVRKDKDAINPLDVLP